MARQEGAAFSQKRLPHLREHPVGTRAGEDAADHGLAWRHEHVLHVLLGPTGRELRAFALEEFEGAADVVGPHLREVRTGVPVGVGGDRLEEVVGIALRVHVRGMEDAPGQPPVAKAKAGMGLLEHRNVCPELLGTTGGGPPGDSAAHDHQVVRIACHVAPDRARKR